MPGAPDSAAVQQMVALFAQSLGRASMDTLQVRGGSSASLVSLCVIPTF